MQPAQYYKFRREAHAFVKSISLFKEISKSQAVSKRKNTNNDKLRGGKIWKVLIANLPTVLYWYLIFVLCSTT